MHVGTRREAHRNRHFVLAGRPQKGLRARLVWGSTVRDIGGAYDPLGYGLVARPVLTLPLRQLNHRARLTAASATFALKAEP